MDCRRYERDRKSSGWLVARPPSRDGDAGGRARGWAITKARGDDVTVVFERPPSTAIPSSVVEVAHAPKAAANSADDEIVRLVRSGAQPQEIRVVTSDKALTDRVRDLGAAVYPAERFRDLIDPRGSNAARRTQ